MVATVKKGMKSRALFVLLPFAAVALPASQCRGRSWRHENIFSTLVMAEGRANTMT